jgi:serine/threonine-protein kinase
VYAPGDVLSRRFRIERVLGTGAMGLVVAAHHLALDTRVAIKLMLPELRAREPLVRRFLREARAAARLSSRHVARVLDVGTLEDGAPFIVMEYLDGEDLATQLRERGPVPVARAAAIVIEACEAIAEAHALGIIHRDLKPANLFVTRDREGRPLIKVLDLGICRLTGTTDDPSDTSDASAIGTPLYMAPEQLRSARSADARSDIWSLGVILYELVTGRVPFRGDGFIAQSRSALFEPLPAMARPGVPRRFEAIVARCLEKAPSKRFPCATDLAAALAPLAAGSRETAPAMRSRRWWRLSIAAAIAVAAAGGLWLASPREVPASPPAGLVMLPMAPGSPPTSAAPPPAPVLPAEPPPPPPRRRVPPVSRRPIPRSAIPAAAAFDPLASPD